MGYTVKSGDTLWQISKQTGVSVEDLKRYNNLSGNTIHPGQTLTLSGGNKRLNTKDTESKPIPIKSGAYYVNFPDYDVALTNSGEVRAPLGHAGVLVVGDDGSRKYYEYGRYTNGNVGVQLDKDENNNHRGNWRSSSVQGNTLDAISENLLHLQGSHSGNTVRLTHIGADPKKVTQYILDDANNKDRDSYSVCGYNDKSCGSMASEAIEAGTPFYTNALHGLIGALSQISNPIIGKSIFGKTGVTTGGILGLISGKSTPQDYENQYRFNGTYTYSRNK